MDDDILQHYRTYLIYVLIGGFFFMAFWESLWPLRKAIVPTSKRWLVNFGLFFVNLLGYRWLMPLGYLGAASLAQQNGWGLFNLLSLGTLPSVILTLLLFDLMRYWVHRAFHAIPFLWRFHTTHHSDPDYDVTIGFRFHPAEALATWYTNLGMIFLVGPSVAALFVLESLLLINTVFTHGNVRMPGALDRLLRRLFVTPDMHRIHHSTYRAETDSNFGSIFSLWDRWFGSYVAAPAQPLPQLNIGLDTVPAKDALNFGDLLLRPFKRAARIDG